MIWKVAWGACVVTWFTCGFTLMLLSVWSIIRCVRELFIQKGVLKAKGDGSIDGNAWEC